MKTISLELSKRLWHKGDRKLSSTQWVKIDGKWGLEHLIDDEADGVNVFALDRSLIDEEYPAYTLDELWAMLPDVINDEYYKNLTNYCCCYENDPDDYDADIEELHRVVINHNPTEAAGLMLEWLLDNKYKINGGDND